MYPKRPTRPGPLVFPFDWIQTKRTLFISTETFMIIFFIFNASILKHLWSPFTFLLYFYWNIYDYLTFLLYFFWNIYDHHLLFYFISIEHLWSYFIFLLHFYWNTYDRFFIFLLYFDWNIYNHIFIFFIVFLLLNYWNMYDHLLYFYCISSEIFMLTFYFICKWTYLRCQTIKETWRTRGLVVVAASWTPVTNSCGLEMACSDGGFQK